MWTPATTAALSAKDVSQRLLVKVRTVLVNDAIGFEVACAVAPNQAWQSGLVQPAGTLAKAGPSKASATCSLDVNEALSVKRKRSLDIQ